MGEIVQNWNRTSIESVLPEEYKKEVASKNAKTSSKIDVIVTQWKALCSVEGYVTKGPLDAPDRLWVRVHRDASKNPDGMLFTLVSKYSMYCWKSAKITPKGTPQFFLYQPGRKDEQFTFYKEASHGQFPYVLKNVLQRTSWTEKVPELNFIVDHLAIGDLENIRAFCGNGRPYLPPSLDDALFPPLSTSV